MSSILLEQPSLTIAFSIISKKKKNLKNLSAQDESWPVISCD